MRVSKYLFSALLLTCCFTKTRAQVGLCPDNLDFEFGDFTNWQFRYGWVEASAGFNLSHLDNIGVIPGRHTIISSLNAGLDPYGGFSTLCPNGSGYSVRLGNNSGGHEAEGISYTFTIPAAASTFSILYYYAVVLQDPNHQPPQQPRFRARIIDVATGASVPCVTFDFVATANLPGFQRSFSDPSVWYKDWTPISINLSGYAGRTIMLEFITSDCTFNAHFGYAYMDVSSVCNGVISGSTLCAGDTSVTMTAPFGFEHYTWYTDNTFTTIIDTTQTITLHPAPTVGSIFPVIVEPYAGFGCRDTLYAVITVSPKPVSNAGPDTIVCSSNRVRIGGPPSPAHSYLWTPSNQVSNPTIANPFAWVIPPNPTEFIVKTTDILTGCFSYDTAIVTPVAVDTAMNVTGNTGFCVGDPGPTLTVSNAATAIQWYESAGGPIPGATTISYRPLASGTYWAVLTQGGCMDSTRTVPVAVHPLPQAFYTMNNDSGCLGRTSFVFTNTSTTADNAAMNYVWRFSDGTFQLTTDATKTFLNKGNYSVKLLSTTSFGCKDSTQKTVYVFPNGIPNFTWDSICTGRPVLFRNLSNENGSPLVNYSWDFNNGGPASVMKDPLPVTYNTAPGKIDVLLKMTALGCESDTQSIRKTVQVNKQAPGLRYRDITVPLGSSRFVHVRDSIGESYNWRPATQLSSYSTRYTEFFATSDDVKYLIDMADRHTCVTTDTLLMLVLKKPGFYLPTAFTPNGDGLNDLVRPYLVGMKGLISFSIYNRWGNLVFFTKTYGEGWNGKYKGLDQAAGVYIWILEFTDNNDKPVREKGTITIIR